MSLFSFAQNLGATGHLHLDQTSLSGRKQKESWTQGKHKS